MVLHDLTQRCHLRNILWLLCLSWCIASTVSADAPVLTQPQSNAFRLWFMRMITEQFRQGPSPRWVHRDCAGLVRFAAYEALRPHDGLWFQANGIVPPMPPEANLTSEQQLLLNSWEQIGTDKRAAYASAIAIIQENSRFISKDMNQALPGDLLFFDQGDDQHLMIWMGSYIAYHTGRPSERESGLRKYTLQQFMNWNDTRWRPEVDNPNFIGVFRLSFLR